MKGYLGIKSQHCPNCGLFFSPPSSINPSYSEMASYELIRVLIPKGLTVLEKAALVTNLLQIATAKVTDLQNAYQQNNFVLNATPLERILDAGIELTVYVNLSVVEGVISFMDKTSVTDSSEFVVSCPNCHTETLRVKW